MSEIRTWTGFEPSRPKTGRVGPPPAMSESRSLPRGTELGSRKAVASCSKPDMDRGLSLHVRTPDLLDVLRRCLNPSRSHVGANSAHVKPYARRPKAGRQG